VNGSVSEHGTWCGKVGTVEAKGVLTIVGLGCDLIGAFFLSIPLVWNIDSLINFTKIQASVIRKGIVRTTHEGAVTLQLALLAGGSIFVLGLAAGSGLAYVLYPVLSRWGTRGVLPTIIGFFVGWLLSVAMLALFAGVLSAFLRWVRSGQHERRVGQFGLLLLCLGFLCQAVVNLL
jgi:hypothetical protein